MENFNEVYREPRYTKQWIALQMVYALVLGGVMSLVTKGICSMANGRLADGLLGEGSHDLILASGNYCFAIVSVTLLSVTLIELAFRKTINVLQYILMSCAMGLFYLLLLAMGEHMPFWTAYTIVAIMTIGLITVFVNAITRNPNAMRLTAAILLGEYAVILLLVYLGSMVLLVGSLLLFAIIACAMYFTIKLKMEDDELVLK